MSSNRKAANRPDASSVKKMNKENKQKDQLK